MLSLRFCFLSALFVVALRWAREKQRNPKGLPRPPGPKGYPIIGNLLDMSWNNSWLIFDRLFKEYGDIVYLEIFGQPFLILSSLRTTKDILDRRSGIYSSRPSMPMIVDLMKSDYNLAALPYGQMWRERRRTFHQYFHPNAVHVFKPAQIEVTHALLRRLLKTPENFSHYIKHSFAELIMKVAYGIQIDEENDPYLKRAEDVLAGGNEAGVPGAFLVDFFPWLKYVPTWFPGATFKRKAEYWAQVNHDVRKLPFKLTSEQVSNGVSPQSLAATLIDRLPPADDPSYEAKRTIAEDVCAVAFVGGADTTMATVQTCFLGLAMHPDILQRAQEEIDRVVGNDRLPDFGDQDSLPFIKAVAMECMRWIMVLPSAFVHTNIADDIYEGYFIPKGTFVLGNGWSILHDPEIFKNPFEFNPDRYMKNGQFNDDLLSPHCAAFGYGRRICPGRYMSDNSLYAIVASVVAVFDIRAPLDEAGNLVKLTPETTSAFLVHPLPFKCRITPRSTKAEALIRGTATLS